MLFLGLAGGWFALKRAEKQAGSKRAAPVTNAAQAQADKPSPETLAQPEAVMKAGFRASPVTLQKNLGSSLIYAVGTLTNAAARQRFGVKVLLDLFDDAGNKVGEATDYQQVIEPRSEWNFRALVVTPKTASASITSIREER